MQSMRALRLLLSGDKGTLPDAIVFSSAVPSNNAELEAARAAGIPVYKRAQWRHRVTDGYGTPSQFPPRWFPTGAFRTSLAQ